MMTTKQSVALQRIADLEGMHERGTIKRGHIDEMLSELRRLHEVNQELLGALKQSMEALEYYADLTEEPSTASGAALIARAAIAKGEQA